MRTKIFKIGLFFLATAVIMAITMPTTAVADDDWDFLIAPFYLWALDINGTQGFGTGAIDLDMKFEDIYPDLETIFTVHFEGVKDQKWGFIVDLSFVDIASTEVVGPATVKSGMTAPVYELDGIYRLGEDRHLIDLLLGLRYYKVENSAAFTGGPSPPAGLSFDKSFDWVDGVVGARYLWNFSPKWHLILRGDVATGGSDLALNGSALFQWQPWEVVGFLGGYRVMDIDYEDGSGADRIVYDIQQAGPILAVTFAW